MARKPRVKKPKNLSLNIEGAFFAWHSLAHVNRELARGLHAAGLDVGVVDESPLPQPIGIPHAEQLESLLRGRGPADLTLRHSFPPDFSPCQEKLVIMQPWEFLGAPSAWVEHFSRNIDQLWVNSNFTRNVFINSGVPAAQVAILPLGYDPSVFHITDDPRAERDQFRFLFVGGTIERKGITEILNSFVNEFGKEANAHLVIKDTGTRHVYSHNNFRNEIYRLIEKERMAITYIDDDLPPESLADLYRSCDCLVQPYRAEGFCLPVIEAMACGLPVIVTQGGPTDDFVLQSCGWKVASRQVQIPQLAGLEAAGGQAWLLPDQYDLRRAMRGAFIGRNGPTRQVGLNAAELAKSNWTWEKVIPQYVEQIRSVVSSKQSVRSSSGNPRISLCMIVRDEERVLEDCLRSAKPFFDEIIVVDTGSVDNTKEIASKYATRVIDFEWVDSFAAARNESLKHATGDWIFWMDADDTLPPNSGEEIRKAAANAPDDIAGFIVPVQFVEEGPSSGTRVDHVKLFRNKERVAFEGRIHEQVLGSLCRDGSSIARCNALVLHSGYDNSVAGQEKKRTRDFHLLELDLEERPNHPFVMFNLGMTHFYTGDPKLAVKWLRKCIKRSKIEESHRRKACVLLALALEGIGKRSEAIRELERAAGEYPDDAEVPFQLGTLHRNSKNWAEARASYLAVLDKQPGTYLSSLDIGIFGFKTLHNIGAIDLETGRFEEAQGWFSRALQSSPANLASADSLLDASLELKDWATSRNAMEHVRLHHGESQLFVDMFTKYQLARLGTDGALHALKEHLYSSSDATPWLLGYTRLLLKSGQVETAVPLLEQLTDRGVAEGAYYMGVRAIQQGRIEEALDWTNKALELNPGHEATLDQIRNLKALIADSEQRQP